MSTVVVLFKIDVSVLSIKANNLECLNGELKFCKSEVLQSEIVVLTKDAISLAVDVVADESY